MNPFEFNQIYAFYTTFFDKKQIKKVTLLKFYMTKLWINFYIENQGLYDIECDINCKVGDFYDLIKPKIISRYEEGNYHVIIKNLIYLKGCKLEEEFHLKHFLDDLKTFPLYITNDPSKLIVDSLPMINIDDYDNLKFFSNDRFSYSLQAIDKKTGKKVILKTFDGEEKKKEQFESLYRYKINSTLNHCGIAQILGFRYPLNEEEKKKTKLLKIQYVNEKNKKIDFNYNGCIVVFEFVKNSTIVPIVSEYLKTKGAKHDLMNPTIRSKIIYGVASIMCYVHRKNIYHSDLKLENILLDENCEPKITGFEKAHYDETRINVDKIITDVDIIAPETFCEGFYSLPIDVYSYAILVYKMFSNKIEFEDRKPVRTTHHYMTKIERGFRLKRPEQIPDPYWDLIKVCWKQNPYERPTFEQIVEELKKDEYAIEEFGMKTNLDELHEYQKRIDSFRFPNLTLTRFNQLQKEVTTLKSIVLPQKVDKKSDNCFIDEEIEKSHEVISKIGEGATSVAYKVIDTKNNQIMCKKILKFVENDQKKFKVLQNSIKEFEILYNLNHPCICRAIGINTSEVITDSNISTKNRKKSEMTTIALFLEFEDYSIQDYLKKMNNTLKTKIVVEIVHAMNFIHKNGLIHRDLKIDNIRLNCIFEAKIIDFGLVRIHEILSDKYSFVDESMTKGVGTISYMSPEMLNKEKYDYKTDVYSFGVVLYFIFIGDLPDQSLKDKMVGNKITMPQPSDSISKSCIEIISKCLSYSPSDRPSFDDILRMIRENSYSLASFVDSNIVSRRDKELDFYEESTK